MYPYNNYVNQYTKQWQQPLNNLFNPQQNTQQLRQQVPHVSGRNGAAAYPMAPNSEVFLIDDTDAVLWLKTTDSAGYPTLFSIPIPDDFGKPPEQKEAARYEALEKRITSLEALINEQSITRNAEQEPTGGTVATDSAG